MMLTHLELSNIIRENIPKRGELLEKPEPLDNGITLMLNNGVKFMTMQFAAPIGMRQRYFVSVDDGFCSVTAIEPDCLAMTPEKFIDYLIDKRGYLVIKKSEIIKRLS